MSHPYLRCRASLNSPLFKENPCSSIGMTVNHDEEPFSLAREINLLCVLERKTSRSFARLIYFKRFEFLMFFLESLM